MDEWNEDAEIGEGDEKAVEHVRIAERHILRFVGAAVKREENKGK